MVNARHPDQLAARDPGRDRLVALDQRGPVKIPDYQHGRSGTSASRSKAGSASRTKASSACQARTADRIMSPTSGSAPAAAHSRKLSARTASSPGWPVAVADHPEPLGQGRPEKVPKARVGDPRMQQHGGRAGTGRVRNGGEPVIVSYELRIRVPDLAAAGSLR